MNIGEFTALSREEQFAEAGKIAGTDPSVFDGMWETESGRGANMLSSAGAEGHFQIMPKTRATMEKRFGTTIDPYNFGQALYTAAHLMKENMGRFKNVPDALRAYNGGWDSSKWTNPETSAYAGKVLGRTDIEASTAEAWAGMRQRGPAAGDLWDQPMDRLGRQAKVLKPNQSALAVKAFADAIAGTPDMTPPTSIQFSEAAAAVQKQQAEAQARKDNTSLSEAILAAAVHEPASVLVQRLLRNPEPADPNFVVPEKELKGYNESEMKDLRAAQSSVEFYRLKFDIDYARGQDEIAFRRGTLFGLGATLLAEAPSAILTGGLTSAGFKAAGIGSIALAQQGRKAAAITSSALEGIVGNVAVTAGLDMLGERQGVGSYGLAAAGGLLNPILGGRALGRIADQAMVEQQAARMVAEMAEKEGQRILEARRRLGEGATADEIKAEVNRIEAEGQRSELAKHTSPIPEQRKMQAGESYDPASIDSQLKKQDEVLTAASEQQPAISSFGDQIAPRWEDPTFNQRRAQAFIANDGGSFLKILDGEHTVDSVLALPKGVTYTKAAAEAVSLRPTRQLVDEIAAKYLPGDRIVVGTSVENVSPTARGMIGTVGDTHIIGIKAGGMPSQTQHTVTHELGHAIYHKWAPLAPKEVLSAIDGEWLAFKKAAEAGDSKAWQQRWSVTAQAGDNPKLNNYNLSRDEYMAEQFVKHLQNKAMSGQLAGTMSAKVIQQITQAVEAVMAYVRDLVGKGVVKPGAAADKFFSDILEGAYIKKAAGEANLPDDLKGMQLGEMAMQADAIPAQLSKEILDFQNDPVALAHGLAGLDLSTPALRAEAKQILNLYKKALADEQTINKKALSKLLEKAAVLDPTSNIMLRSNNPVVRMAAYELLENGAGAAGRRSSAAIAKHLNERAIIGTTVRDLDQNFNLWFKGQGASKLDEAFTSRKRAEFNKLVAEEIEQRRYPGTRQDLGNEVRAAADSMEAAFERARVLQIDAKTNGWSALPETSVGYMPHRMNSLAYRNLTLPQKQALHAELTDQFITISGFDPTFSDALASRYLDRVNARALGGFDAPMGLHQPGAVEVIQEAMQAQGLTRDEALAMLKRHASGAANHTKKRLNIDLRKTIEASDGTSFRLLDLYDTNMLTLLRGQAQRVSGEVALTRHGVMGKPGLDVLRRAMGYGNSTELATKKEIEAFDQVASEFLGQPYGETANKWVDRAVQFNSLSSLGGMGFNQLGEFINAAFTLGWGRMLSTIPELGRLHAEVRALAKGGRKANPWLDSIETMSGVDFGMDPHRMVFPLDNPDLITNSMGADTLHYVDKGLRAGIHLQGIMSGWRAIQSTQVRTVAEQIVLKTAKAMRSGEKLDWNLRDMGFSDDMMARFRKDAAAMVEMEGGKVKRFDITKATDKEAANAFIQAVHRGASQIIQGTFIGETGKYMHSSWLRMLAQFRTFSITAIDKQWNRRLAGQGMIGVSSMMLASMAAAAPIVYARAYLASQGRADKDEYFEKQTSIGAIAKNSLNYIAMSGLTGDVVDGLTALSGSQEYTGGRAGVAQGFVGGTVAPAAGKIDKLWGAVQDTKDGTDPKAFVKELPLARLPYVVPAINAMFD